MLFLENLENFIQYEGLLLQLSFLMFQNLYVAIFLHLQTICMLSPFLVFTVMSEYHKLSIKIKMLKKLKTVNSKISFIIGLKFIIKM